MVLIWTRHWFQNLVRALIGIAFVWANQWKRQRPMKRTVPGARSGYSKRVYEALPERLSKHFAYDSGSSCYVASDLTWDKVELAARAAAYAVGAPVFLRSTGPVIEISREEVRGARSITPSSSWASENES